MSDLGYRLLMPAKIAVGDAREAPRQRQVGVQRNRAFVQGACLLGTLVQKAAHVADQCERPRIASIQRDGAFCQLARAADRAQWIARPALADQENMPVGPPGMRRRVAGLDRQCRREHISGRLKGG